MHNYTFTFKNVTYACVGESDKECAFNLMQFQHCIDTGDWITLNNRILGQLDTYVIVVSGERIDSVKKSKSKESKPKENKIKETKSKVSVKNHSFW